MSERPQGGSQVEIGLGFSPFDTWAQLVRELRGDMLRVAFGFTRDRGTAEHVVQESLLKIVLKIDSFTPTGAAKKTDPETRRSFRAWTLEICSRTALDELKRQGRRPQSGGEHDLSVLPGAENVEERADSITLPREVVEAFRLLPPAHQEVVFRRVLVGDSQQEVAHALGIAEGTVKSALSRSLHKLRDALTPTDSPQPVHSTRVPFPAHRRPATLAR